MAFKMKGFSGFQKKTDPPKPGRLTEKEQQEAADKVREEEKRLLDETTRKRAEQGKVTATINPAFRKNGNDDKKRIAENQDPGSGRSKKEEMAYDMRMTKKEIKRFEKEGNNRAIGMLKSALERQKKAYIELYGKLPGMGTFE